MQHFFKPLYTVLRWLEEIRMSGWAAGRPVDATEVPQWSGWGKVSNQQRGLLSVGMSLVAPPSCP